MEQNDFRANPENVGKRKKSLGISNRYALYVFIYTSKL